MDKYIIRTPRTEPRPASVVQPVKKLKQMTLEGLKGVVVLEDLERAKLALCRPDSTTGDLLQQLGLLAKKTPTKSILDSTGIGEVVSALRGAPDPAVAAEAKRVHKIWKRHHKLKKNRPIIEAVFDLRTQKVRNSARNLIKEALQSNLTAPESSSGRKKQVICENLSMDERYMSDLGTVVSTTSLGYSKGIRIDLDRYENAMSELQQGKPGADVSTGGNKSDLQGKHGADVSTGGNKSDLQGKPGAKESTDGVTNISDLQKEILADEPSFEDHEKILTSASSALDSSKILNVNVNIDLQENNCFDKKDARQFEKKRKLDNADEQSRPKKVKLECRTSAADKTIMSDRQLLTDSSGIKNDEYPGTETKNCFPELSLSVAESRAREKERPKDNQASNGKNNSKEKRGLNDDHSKETQASNDKHSNENRASNDKHSNKKRNDKHSQENRASNDKHSKENRASNDKHSQENRSSNDKHSKENRSSNEKHSQENRSSNDKHSKENRSSNDKHSQENRSSNDKHSKENRSSNDKHSQENRSSDDKHSKQNRASNDKHSKENRSSNDKHSKENRASNDKHSKENRSSNDKHSKENRASNDKHSNENRASNDKHSKENRASNDKHSQENRSSNDKHSKENRASNDKHSKENRSSNVKHSKENKASNKNGYKKERNSSHSLNANQEVYSSSIISEALSRCQNGLDDDSHSNLMEGYSSKCPSIGNPKPILVQPSELEATFTSLNEKTVRSKLNDKHQTDSPTDSRQKYCCVSMEKENSDVLQNKCLNEKSMPTSHSDVVHHHTNPSNRENKSSVNSAKLATSASVKTSNTEQINSKENTSPRTKHSSSSARSNDEITLHEDTSSKNIVPVNIDLDILSEAIERELFFENQRLINKSYRKTIRRLVFTLKHQDRVRRRVLRGRYSAAKIVSKCWQE
ncbi:1-phosphatidylinositol 3-phosphate 5-kinase [Hyalella azteca]|uniref:1-phosphatidylinositol 3-phosphate 5-kinase n=1 Tax=Hyalella azteca TaxID=294128 RepID=A0A8B7NWS6_HYAAZ|nr:1-phosphatidylinositol 3-phosphate 5-kinase [Hyalella azteca]